MVDYSKKLIDDLPQQFKDRERIEALMTVIGKQFNDLLMFYEQLDFQRSLMTAEGAQLDRIGDILCLTRKQAAMINERDSDHEMDDTDYRAMLGYKIMLNYGDATYYDIVRGIKNFCNVYPIRYIESLEFPASFSLELEVQEGSHVILRNLLPVRAAGVDCTYQFRLSAYIEVSSEVTPYTADVPECGMHYCGTWPIRATVGNSQKTDVEVSVTEKGTPYEPPFTGTVPTIATEGYSEETKISAGAGAQPVPYEPEQSGEEVCGTVPDIATLGNTESSTIGLKHSEEGFIYEPEQSGDNPEKATFGYTAISPVSIGVDNEIIEYESGETGIDDCGTKPEISTSGVAEMTQAAATADVRAYTIDGQVCGVKYCGNTQERRNQDE